jgi:uncharacterized small protein (DUF1192 family)
MEGRAMAIASAWCSMESRVMAIDPLADEKPRPKPPAHAIGQDLSTLSLAELDERIALLEREIDRLREMRARKEASKAAASAFFKT